MSYSKRHARENERDTVNDECRVVVVTQHCNVHKVRKYHARSLKKSVPPLVLPKQERAGAGFYFIMLNLPAFQ